MIGILRKLQKLISKFPSKARAPHSPQHSTSKARAPHSPQHSYQQSQSSPQSPSTVPAKPGLPTAPQHSTSEARAPHSPQHSTSKARAPHSRTRKARAPTAPPPVQYQPPGTITGTACLSLAPEEAPSHQGPSQGLPASPQCQKKLPHMNLHSLAANFQTFIPSVCKKVRI